MKDLWNIIGGLIALFIFGYIIYAAFASGNAFIGIVILIVLLIIYLISIREDNIAKENNRKILAEAAAAEEERKGIQTIEKMSESEFITFVKFTIMS